MRAAVVHRLGDAPRLGEHPAPTARPGHTLVRVSAAALNPVDLHIAAGTHPAGAPALPYVPGVEAAGTVVSSEVHAPGARVRVAVPGGFVDGTLAELVSAPDGACVPLPDGLDDEAAAAVGVVGVSALHALRAEAALGSGEAVLVLGATGGLGQALVHLARALGAGEVVAAGRNPDRLARLKDAADETVLLDAAAADRTAGRFDVVLDLLWGPCAPLAQAALRPGGRWVNLGQLAGGSGEIDAAALRHRHLRLSGFSGASLPASAVTAGYRELAELAAAGALPLTVETHPLSAVAEVWAAQAASPGAKLVLKP